MQGSVLVVQCSKHMLLEERHALGEQILYVVLLGIVLVQIHETFTKPFHKDVGVDIPVHCESRHEFLFRSDAEIR